MEYKVIRGHSSDLEKKVTQLLEEGWQLHGSLCCDDHRLNQAMTRISPVEKEYSDGV